MDGSTPVHWWCLPLSSSPTTGSSALQPEYSAAHARFLLRLLPSSYQSKCITTQGLLSLHDTAVKPSYEILTLHIVKTSLTKIKHLEWPNEKVEENGLAFFWPFWSSHILPWLCNPLRACTHVTPCVHGSITPQPMVRSEKFQKQTPIILPKLVQQQQVWPSTTLCACTHATPCVHGSITLF